MSKQTEPRINRRTLFKHAASIISLLTLFAPFKQTAAESIASGGTLFTVYRDTPVRDSPSAIADVIETLPEAGTKVTWIEADANHPRWQKIRIVRTPKILEGYIPEANLSLQDPEKATPVWIQTQNGGRAAAGLVIATAATRAFMNFDPSVHQFANMTNNMEAVAWLAKLSVLEQAIGSTQINQHNKNAGIFPLPSMPTHSVSPDKTFSSAYLLPGSMETEDASNRPQQPETELQKCIDFGNYPIEESEARQISDLAAVALIDRYGGLMIDRPEGVNDLNLYLFTIAQNLAARSMRLDPYRLLILNTPQINAFSTPGGDIFLTRGLLDLLKAQGNEAQLAFIIGHEIKHIVNRDGLERWRESKMALCKEILDPDAQMPMRELRPAMQAAVHDSCQGSLNLANAAPKLVKTLTEHFVRQVSCKSYKQDAELAADEEGLRLAILAGYQPDFINLFSQMQENKGFENHPKKEMRQAHLQAFFQSLRPRPGFFGYQDWPFQSYPLVPFEKNQFQSLELYEADAHHAKEERKEQIYLACDG